MRDAHRPAGRRAASIDFPAPERGGDTRHLCRHDARKRLPHRVPFSRTACPSFIDALSARDPDPSYQAAARAELRGLLERQLEQLPHAFRIVFVLRSVEELSVDETARCLGIPEATVRSRHFRAKRSHARSNSSSTTYSSSAAAIAIASWRRSCSVSPRGILDKRQVARHDRSDSATVRVCGRAEDGRRCFDPTTRITPCASSGPGSPWRSSRP
ncbi:RNA polymerase sigma factor [Burkholderia humptydooensis MSMB43]|uniref:RNA polymerase sigma factor n=1 Tax=Burkholderia humptydooensis MSMB43 TaxID=441157 RepID=A0ABN0GB03_9BURK|nr:RNA polymerase sigma factor [Burkholderia humptydooensis MSMB43]